MTPAEFLAVVLPSPGHGYYCAAGLTETRKAHAFEETITDLFPTIDKWHGAQRDVYFALATYAEKGSRTADNARFLKALFIDMDGYESKKAAGLALGGFLEATGLAALGRPWIVNSGGGLHCYWPLDKEVDVATWKPVAENFKRLCKQQGMAIDMSVTADAARILRVPDTTNFKKKYNTPRPVKLLSEGDIFSLEQIGTVINSLLAPAAQARVFEPIAGQRPTQSRGITQVKLMQNSITLFENLYDATMQGTGCAQLKAYIDNPTEDGLEPIWRGLLSWAKVCDDGAEWATWLSDLHPYDAERQRRKMAEIKGPYPCLKMDSENPGICGGCPHFTKITNPLKFGRELKTDNAEKVIDATPVPDETEEDLYPTYDEEGHEVATDDPHNKLVRPTPPRGFSYGAQGGVYCDRMVEDADGTKSKKQVQILPYDLFVVDMLKQEDDYAVHLVATRPDGIKHVTMPSKCVVSKDETVKFLASQNVIASFGKGNDANLFDFVRACVEDASLSKKAVEVPLQCGWQKDGSFVYSGRVFTKDGREVRTPMPGLENINKSTVLKGTLEDWREVWDMFSKKKMHTMLALCLDSFGSALMRFSEYDGFVWYIGATESGTGKSLALSAKAGVWGHPTHYRTSSGTSPVAMQQRMGLLNSLPLLIDEITAKARENLEWAPTFIFDQTEGQGKERMESGANKERVNNSRWSGTCTMTGNVHLTDYMSGARKHSSNGELLRMLQWSPNIALEWTPEDRETLKKLNNNYGVAGEAWVRWLVRHQDVAQEMFRRVHARLKVALSFSDDERYWHAGCTEVVTAALLLGPKYANILTLPVEGIIEALKTLVERARGNLRRNARTAEDVLNAYTRDNYGGFIVLRKLEGKSILSTWGDGSDTKDTSITRSKVLGRIEHGLLQPGYVEYFIEEQLLKQHCVSMSFGYADFKQQMEAVFKVSYIKKDMLAKTNGPSMRVNVMHITRPVESLDEDQLSVGQAKEG